MVSSSSSSFTRIICIFFCFYYFESELLLIKPNHSFIFLNKDEHPRDLYRVRDDVLVYLETVKASFQHNKRKYNHYQSSKLVRELRTYTYTSPQKYDELLNIVKARVKRLFKEHQYLIMGLNMFMPKEHIK